MLKKNYYKQREDDMKILIATAKVRNNLTNEALAKKIGMPPSTFNKKSCHPGLFRCSQLWLLEELAGRNEQNHIKLIRRYTYLNNLKIFNNSEFGRYEQ